MKNTLNLRFKEVFSILHTQTRRDHKTKNLTMSTPVEFDLVNIDE